MLPLSVYQFVFESAIISRCVVSPTPDAILLAVNKAFLEATDTERDKVIGTSLLAPFPHEVAPEPGQGHDTDTAIADLTASIARVIDTGMPDVLTMRRCPAVVPMPDGGCLLEARDWQVVNTPIFDAAGCLVCISHSMTDVTLQLRNQERLRSSSERQAFHLALADRLRPLMAPEEILAAASEMTARHMGITRVSYGDVNEDEGTFLILSDWTASGYPGIAGTVRRLDDFGPQVVASLRLGDPVVVADVQLDPRTAPHAAAYASLHIRANLAIPLVKSGKLVAIMSMQHVEPHEWTAADIELVNEIAERTWTSMVSARAHAQLRAERDQSQYIFDSMMEGFALIDADWIMRQLNAAGQRMMRLDPAQVIGRNHWDIWPEARGTDIEKMYQRVRATGKAESLEFHHVFPDQSGYWVELRATPAMGGGLAVFLRDITARKTSEEKLHEADRRKDEFLAMLAHELRNPLAPISAAAEYLHATTPDAAQLRKASDIITRQVGHMTALVNDLLDVSRVTRGLITLDRKQVDLRHVVGDAVEQVTPLIAARHHHLSLHLAPGDVMVTGDEKRLVQIVANLINNAAKYTPEGGNIEVRSAVQGDGNAQLVLEVSDDGIGMTPDLALQVFDLFAQAERSSDRSLGGLGLGLALVKSLVELHGGTVSCRSEGPGRGSQFTVLLPRSFASSGTGNISPAQTLAHIAARPLRVLVVDDNVDAAAMLKMLLQVLGHTVQVEHGSLAALQRAQTESFDVYLLDIGLPEMDGNELARRLRENPSSANALMIAVTGYGQQGDREQSRLAGFNHHLVKPVDMTKLSALLEQALPSQAA